MSFVSPVVLKGAHVLLEPLSPNHLDELIDAVSDGELWKLWFTTIPSPDGMATEIERRLKLQNEGSMLPFVVRFIESGKLCGMTTFMNIDGANKRMEIGSTWYSKSVQRTSVNTECKLLMLTHAFEHLECIAVEFRTHFMNQRSRNAITRLGAKQDGILRNHQQLADGSYRDTVVYSIIAQEWLAVKNHLTGKLKL